MNEQQYVPVEAVIPDHYGEKTGYKAWQVNLERSLRLAAPGANNEGLVCAWIVRQPDAHPSWNDYTVLAVRATNLPPAKVPEGFTHAIIVAAMDPEKAHYVEGVNGLLSPSNFEAFFTADSDEQARRRIEDAVVECVQGKLSCDSDALNDWIDRFDDGRVNRLAEGEWPLYGATHARLTLAMNKLAGASLGELSSSQERMQFLLDAAGPTPGCGCEACQEMRKLAN